MAFDCVVVGAGLAGLTAAVRIAEHDLRPLVVAKGVGSLYLGGSTIDVLGYEGDVVESPERALPGFCSAHPSHPYSRVGPETISSSIAWLEERFENFTGDLAANMLLPTAVGATKPTAVAPRSIAAGELRNGGETLLVGFDSLKDFYPRLAADNLNALLPHLKFRAEVINVSPEREPDVNTIRFGRAFDDVEFRKEVVRACEGRLDGCHRVGFPAVLGLREAATAWPELEDALGVPVFEIPTLPPSIPGIRLHEQMKARLRAAGGRLIVNNTVVGVNASGKRVSELIVDNGSRRITVPARAVVLATGGVGAGGIAMNSKWEIYEPALGLPVWGKPAADVTRFYPDVASEQPLDRTGIGTDERLRPVDDSGNVIYDNVFVAGATLAGARPWREGSGNGISLATGYAAAEHAAEETG